MMIRTVKKYAMGDMIEYLPVDHKEKKYPMLLFLHGMGERGVIATATDGSKYSTNIDVVERNEIPKQLRDGFEAPFIVLAPQLPNNQGGYYMTFWNAIKPVLDAYAAPEYHLAALSLGAIGGFNLLSYAPGYFKTFGCCCGADNPKAYDKYRTVHIKAWHGDRDSTVKITSITNTINALKSLGADAELKVYPGLGHNIWNLAFSPTDPESYWQWVKQHIGPDEEENIELVTKTEIINGTRVRYTVDGNVYEHEL